MKKYTILDGNEEPIIEDAETLDDALFEAEVILREKHEGKGGSEEITIVTTEEKEFSWFAEEESQYEQHNVWHSSASGVV